MCWRERHIEMCRNHVSPRAGLSDITSGKSGRLLRLRGSAVCSTSVRTWRSPTRTPTNALPRICLGGGSVMGTSPDSSLLQAPDIHLLMARTFYFFLLPLTSSCLAPLALAHCLEASHRVQLFPKSHQRCTLRRFGRASHLGSWLLPGRYPNVDLEYTPLKQLRPLAG